MEKIVQVNKQNKPMPPGFHAHLGLLYGEAGRFDEMRNQFLIEKELFPESAEFIDFLLASEASGEETSGRSSQEGKVSGAEL